MLTGSQVIVLAVPVFLGLIVLEFAWGRARGRNTYALGDAVNSLGLGVLLGDDGPWGPPRLARLLAGDGRSRPRSVAAGLDGPHP